MLLRLLEHHLSCTHGLNSYFHHSTTTTRKMNVAETPTAHGPRKTTCPLNVVVVGCGLGGLATAYCLGRVGHKVTVLESAPAIADVGAGIQISPNVSRLLIRWGLGPQLEKFGVTPEALVLCRYANGEIVSRHSWGDNIRQEYGSPYYHIHRADYIKLLMDLAKPYMTLRLNSRVMSVNPSIPSLTLQSGEIVQGDVVIGADGVKSMLRDVVVGGPDRPRPTGDAAYRATIPTALMLKDPDLRPLVEEGEMICWMGPDKHIMAYNIRGKKEYNMVMAHKDQGSVESYTAEVPTKQMRKDFEGWEPRVQKLLALVESTLEWKLMDRAPLSTWVHKDGKMALLGDACHPMLPYRAQGAAMAIEDAACLGILFSHITNPSQITPMLHTYQDIRYVRTSATQSQSTMNREIFHYEDGPQQEQRDAQMRAAMDAENTNTGNANMWADKAKNMEQFGYDVEMDTEQWWERASRFEKLVRL